LGSLSLYFPLKSNKSLSSNKRQKVVMSLYIYLPFLDQNGVAGYAKGLERVLTQ
jgi:hypothetical protein